MNEQQKQPHNPAPGYVLIVGDVNVDLVVRTPQKAQDGHMEMPAPQLLGGGSAANTAHALKCLGLAAEFMGTVGKDAYGRFVEDEFDAASIGHTGLFADENLHTVCVFAFVQPDGERFLWPWPQEAQSFRYMEEAHVPWSIVDGASWVHTSGMVFSSNTSAPHTVTAILQRAKAQGIPTSFDLNLRAENGALDKECLAAVTAALPFCRYIFGSADEEFLPLSGNAPGSDGIDAAASFATNKRTVIARMGANGSVAITPSERFFAPAYPAAVVDTIAAGDTYNAGFIAACLWGCTLQEAVQYGLAAGAHAVSCAGSRTAPTLQKLKLIMHGEKENVS